MVSTGPDRVPVSPLRPELCLLPGEWLLAATWRVVCGALLCCCPYWLIDLHARSYTDNNLFLQSLCGRVLMATKPRIRTTELNKEMRVKPAEFYSEKNISDTVSMHAGFLLQCGDTPVKARGMHPLMQGLVPTGRLLGAVPRFWLYEFPSIAAISLT